MDWMMARTYRGLCLQNTINLCSSRKPYAQPKFRFVDLRWDPKLKPTSTFTFKVANDPFQQHFNRNSKNCRPHLSSVFSWNNKSPERTKVWVPTLLRHVQKILFWKQALGLHKHLFMLKKRFPSWKQICFWEMKVGPFLFERKRFLSFSRMKSLHMRENIWPLEIRIGLRRYFSGQLHGPWWAWELLRATRCTRSRLCSLTFGRDQRFAQSYIIIKCSSRS